MCDCKGCKNYEKKEEKEEKFKWEGKVQWNLENGRIIPYAALPKDYFHKKFANKLDGKITNITIEEV